MTSVGIYVDIKGKNLLLSQLQNNEYIANMYTHRFKLSSFKEYTRFSYENVFILPWYEV
jgi:hypothetical protein